MSRLYVANVSRKKHVICYRLDFDKDGNPKDSNRRFEMAKQQEVPAGRQVIVGGDFHANQITDIVDQLAAYGMIGVVDTARPDGRVHELIYNIDQPVPAKVMERVRDMNTGSLIKQGGELRKKAAVATNETVQKVVADQFAANGIDAEPTDKTDVTFEQVEQSEAGEKPIAEGFHVEPAPKSPTRPNRRRKSN
jgi:hypothetical protein